MLDYTVASRNIYIYIYTERAKTFNMIFQNDNYAGASSCILYNY